MLYLIIVIFSIIVGLLRGGELERLSHLTIESVHIFAFALLLRGLLWVAEIMNIAIIFQYSSIILIFSYLLLLFATFKNLNLYGFKYITLGILLNAFVIIVNGGKMPVLLNSSIVGTLDTFAETENMIYLVNNSKALFAFLGDVLPLPNPLPQTSILSVGDIIIFIGLFVLIQNVMTEEESI
ncbi:MAG: DUF5317 domain-containing protein [Candidatus Caldatribacteriota bacterium]|jgi:hypothetical protein|nr:DUF5317 domain-containing protein [Atribacterota bacterium]MDD3030931.1 DUF5317 domain-containing protein [Atribacterota bacterium]MDD3640454.1 DUF5317 domain-containing protein [Atribacterota bacterium]MDD4288598.1 DUF5317 domain-containing protein [Atribacterota bacterium]MDD4764799.1 DUF5317 domain-containing protein [Atribacterota bacterium]